VARLARRLPLFDDGGIHMRLWRRAAVTSDPDPDTCTHSWRLRDLSVALPGPYVCEVCDGCGSLRIHGPEAITGPPSNVADGAALHLESLDRQATPRHATSQPE
jgi:hypothetical protein